jgi:hypothetical protein
MERPDFLTGPVVRALIKHPDKMIFVFGNPKT